MMNQKRIIIGGIIAIVFFVGITIFSTKNSGETNFGATNIAGDGIIGSVYSSTTAPMRVLTATSSVYYREITNAGSEAVFVWLVTQTQVQANSNVTRLGGLYLAPGGSWNAAEDNGYMWSGDVWISTSSAEQLITFVEKSNNQ